MWTDTSTRSRLRCMRSILHAVPDGLGDDDLGTVRRGLASASVAARAGPAASRGRPERRSDFAELASQRIDDAGAAALVPRRTRRTRRQGETTDAKKQRRRRPVIPVKSEPCDADHHKPVMPAIRTDAYATARIGLFMISPLRRPGRRPDRTNPPGGHPVKGCRGPSLHEAK